MKFSLLSFKRVSAIAALGLLTGLPISAQAATQTWINGSVTWDLSAPSFNPGGVAWVNGNDAVFSTAGAETITIGDSLTMGFLDNSGAGNIFDNSGGFSLTFTGTGIIGANAATINNSGSVTFQAGSVVAGTTIDNVGGLVFLDGSSNTANLIVTNGGTIDASGHTGAASLATVNNLSTFAGTITPGNNQLTVGNITLSNMDPGTVGQNTFNFTPVAPNTGGVTFTAPYTATNYTGTPAAGQGRVVVGAGGNVAFPTAFDGAVTIAITGANIQAGTYTLIDWAANAGATQTGLNDGTNNTLLNVGDFVLDTSGATNLNLATHLEIQETAAGSGRFALVLVAVPEPATIAMPLIACLGLLGLRRRASRMPVVQA